MVVLEEKKCCDHFAFLSREWEGGEGVKEKTELFFESQLIFTFPFPFPF